MFINESTKYSNVNYLADVSDASEFVKRQIYTVMFIIKDSLKFTTLRPKWIKMIIVIPLLHEINDYLAFLNILIYLKPVEAIRVYEKFISKFFNQPKNFRSDSKIFINLRI